MSGAVVLIQKIGVRASGCCLSPQECPGEDKCSLSTLALPPVVPVNWEGRGSSGGENAYKHSE